MSIGTFTWSDQTILRGDKNGTDDAYIFFASFFDDGADFKGPTSWEEEARGHFWRFLKTSFMSTLCSMF